MNRSGAQIARTICRALAGAVLASRLVCAGAAAPQAPAYPAGVYPPPGGASAPVTEIAFRETAETRKYGYDAGFPAGPRRSVRVDDFGAKPDGVTDCTQAFARALTRALASRGAAEIVFARRGRYFFRPDRARGSDDLAILTIRRARNLVIRGQGPGTVIVSGDPALGALRVTRSRSVLLRDFSIDYNPLPFTQGAVVGVDPDGGWFDLRIDPGYPSPRAVADLIPGSHGGFRLAEANGGAQRWPLIGGLSITGIAPNGADVWRLATTTTSPQERPRIGERFVYVGRRIAQMALGADETRDFQLRSVTVHASPTCGLGLANVEGVSITNYCDAPPAGSTRMLSSNADGIFCHGVRSGITIRGARFLGQGDDCINLHTPALSKRYVQPAPDGGLLLNAAVDVRTGDTIEVMDPAAGTVKGRVRVTSARRSKDGGSVQVRVAPTMASIGYAPDRDWLYPLELSCSNFKIAGCRSGANRSRCLLIQARHGLIEANTFENAEGYGVILAYGGTAWQEGVLPADVLIRNNLFRNVTGFGMAGVIEISGTAARDIKRIRVVGNRFVNTRKMAVAAFGCDGLEVTGNSVVGRPGMRNTWNHPEWYPVDCSVYLENCANTRITGLTVRDPDLTQCAVFIGPKCRPGSSVTVQSLAAHIKPGVPPVLDRR